MKISIIIPVYKVEDFLSQCVDSILNQTYKNIEVVLVDDGSPDRCGEICDRYSQLDERVKVVHKVNGGLSDARNVGLQNSTGEYIIFVDSDDFWINPQGLSVLVDEISKDSGIDFIGFNCSFYYPSKNSFVKWPSYTENILNARNKDEAITSLAQSGIFPVSAWMKIIRRDFLVKNNISFIKGIVSEDIPWFIELLDCSKKCRFLNLYLYAYRREREGSITRSFSEKGFNDLLNNIRRELKLMPQRKLNNETKSALYSFCAYEFCILLAVLVKLPKQIRKEKRKELLEYSWLLKYNENPKVKKVCLFKKIFGRKLTELALRFYISQR